MDLKGKRVLVTGGTSFIGKYVCRLLEDKGAVVDPCPHSHCDLLVAYDARKYIEQFNPEAIIHMAGFNGNIDFNRQFPGEIFWDNSVMANTIMAIAGIFKKGYNTDIKLVSVLPSCAYTDMGSEATLHEEDFVKGQPHPSVACHGLAKRNLFYLSKFNSLQMKLNAVCVVLNNVMGPGDSTDLNKTKVSMSLIKKFVDAKRNNTPSVELWGTGVSKRELLYVEDAAEGIVRVLESYDDSSEPLNIGTGVDISIKDLADLIKELVGYTGEIKWDTTKGDGQLKKLLANSKMKSILQWEPQVSLREGLEKTIQWYKENH